MNLFQALEVAPDQVHFKFNVAFVQIQIAQMIYTLPETQRTLEEVETAATGLDEAIDSFSAIAKSPNPPFPRGDIEQRANMGRNTMRRQLDRAIQSQREYEQKNEARLQQAREMREAEIRKREDDKKKVEEAAAEQKRKIAEERQKMQERDRELAEQRLEDERRKEEAEMTTDSETGEKIKKKAKRKAGGGKRKKKGAESGTEADGTEGEDGGRSRLTSNTPASSGDERPRRRKKRKLERKGKAQTKYKSSELVIDSDSDDEANATMIQNAKLAEKYNSPLEDQDTSMHDNGDTADAVEQTAKPRPRAARIIDEEDDEDDAIADRDDVPMVDATVAAVGNGPDTELDTDL